MKLLLVGAPHSGKSSVLRRLAEFYPGNADGMVVEVTRANRVHLADGLAAWLGYN